MREHWGELLHVLLPLLDQVVRTGEAFWAHDHPFPLSRHGFVERTYFDISYDPVPLGSGLVGGVLCLVTETTGRVLSQRRMRTLSELGVGAVTVQQADEIAREVATVLARNPDDVPFAQLYLGEAGALRRVASTLADAGAGPELITPGGGSTAGTAAAEVLATGKPLSVPAAGFTGPPVRPEKTPESEPEIEIALVLPITSGSEVVGVLVAGVHPMYRLPGAYREFYDVLATTVSASVANAMSHEQERRRAAALAELDRAKTEFFSNVSHEFRTPLTLIAGPTEDALADQADPLSPGQRRRLEIVRRNAGRLRRLVDDLLDVARIEAGRLQADTVALDLAQTTRGIAESFAPAVERAGLRMRIDCPPLEHTVVVDPDMWEKILLNLLSNALKYTHEGQISVQLRALGDQVELTVTDTGIGIPADQLPLLFQRFHRVRGAAGRSHEGTGIGLALVHELIRLHDGEVAVDSRPGRGSTFTVRLPCGGTAITVGAPKRTSMVPRYLDEVMQWSGRPGAQVELSDLTAAESDDRMPRATVLIVEDNADLRAFLTTLLASCYTVIGTADGRAALTAIARHRPDLVLTEVTMPELDGFELLAALRGDPQTAAIPVILLSARAGADAAVEGLTAGADDYLVKPFSAQNLLARVRSNLELARLRNHESAWRIALVNAV
ncbi:MAG TPA: ATP-binding protein, partial [Pseudonocardiaceae bacterium]|nr:ATP-binding protein [Pseudonocardiaceae bacterium]